MTVSIIDYGMGNIRSVGNAFKYLDAETEIVDSPRDLKGDKIVIPGVGAFGDAIENLNPFLPKIEAKLDSGIPVLGICIGMQILFERSDESPTFEGMALLRGEVKRIETEHKLPHIGWNSINIKRDSSPLFENIQNGFVYYAHTFHAKPERNIKTAVSEYGAEVTASVWDGEKIFGVQFHPEKSGKLGLKILKNFLEV